MAKILVVDDETDLQVLIKQKFRKKIRNNDYEFVFAINGTDALNQLETHADVDLVLSDINMAPMDGRELLHRLRQQHLTGIEGSRLFHSRGHPGYLRTEQWYSLGLHVRSH